MCYQDLCTRNREISPNEPLSLSKQGKRSKQLLPDQTTRHRDNPLPPPSPVVPNREKHCRMSPRTRTATKRGAKTASTAVFPTTEILEQILLQLPLKDILLSTRVSRHLNATVATSLPIQRALFMSPESACQILRHRDSTGVARIHKDDHSREFRGAGRGVMGGYDFIPARANPLLAKIEPPFS